MFGQVDGAICANSTAKVRLSYFLLQSLSWWCLRPKPPSSIIPMIRTVNGTMILLLMSTPSSRGPLQKAGFTLMKSLPPGCPTWILYIVKIALQVLIMCTIIPLEQSVRRRLARATRGTSPISTVTTMSTSVRRRSLSPTFRISSLPVVTLGIPPSVEHAWHLWRSACSCFLPACAR